MVASKRTVSPSPDQAAAHQFLTELRTRISTQPLAYQHGVEARALESMWEVFTHARDAIKKNPGCEKFARRTTHVLNRVIRPLTAKWHRALVEGRLDGRDGADEFRGELRAVQEKLHKFARALHQMAYGKPWADSLTPDVMEKQDLDELFAAVPFGFTPLTSSDDREIRRRKEEAEKIKNDENTAVRARRGKQGIKTEPGEDAIGLALSGGGIRSATFSLGVVQVLAEKRLLNDVDFLSTVSGGGYTGSFLTQRLGNNESQSEVAGPHGPDPEPVRYLRQHAQFLSGNLKKKWGMATATLAGMVLNWTVPLMVIMVLAVAAHLISTQWKVSWPPLLFICGGLCVVATVAYGFCMRLGRKPSLVSGRILGAVLAATGILGMAWGLEAFFPGFLKDIGKNWGKTGGISAVLAVVVAAVPGILRFVPVLKEPKIRQIALKIALLLASVLVPLLAIVLFYAFRGLAEDHFWPVVGIAVGLAAVALLVININLTGPHRLYRDSLARTFIQKTENGTPDVKLANINPQDTAPYHLVNAALNVPASENPALKDRDCDFFLFSKKWTGSPATGYRPTRRWKANSGDLDLATAMAVSGAAFSSHMGLASMPALTALLTLLNVRLGFWIKKPPASGLNNPGFLCLLREMTGTGLTEKARWLNLSDGGHIENLAIYELLRRRCKFIICVDGESDPGYTFQGLMTLVRHAQIDFGVRIDPHLDGLRPDPETGSSKCHFHLCRIHYPAIPDPKTPVPAGVGLLLYLKLSVTGNEPELIKRYRLNHPDFPHQTTLDQFFDQEQFEAYRQLGVHVAEGLFLPALTNNHTEPKSVPEWFRDLAKNLLEPVKN